MKASGRISHRMSLNLHPNTLPLSDDRVSVRRFCTTDLAAFQAYRHDVELGRFQGWSPQSDRDALQFITEMAEAPLFRAGHWVQLAMEDSASRSLIGDLGVFISTDEQQAEIGFTLSRHAQGMGLATRAILLAIPFIFASTPIQQMVAITDTRNLASIRLLERVGMQRRETRSEVFKGQPCQEHVYFITRQDAANPSIESCPP